MGVPKGLTVKQQKFCKHYSIHRDINRAAIETEISLQTAKEWLEIPKINETWQRYRGEWIIKSGITPDEIMAGITDIAFDKSSSTKDQLSAMRLMAEIFGMTGGNKTSSTNVTIELGAAEAEQDDYDDIEEIEEEYVKPKRTD